ncbi:MAG: SufS family cysteine desulfurase [Candidatus Micrarchaeota archaeon]|nr:SufS family cysteine desulfurase [Candidatus Micrarchaeota archaeon]
MVKRLDVDRIREDFPILARKFFGKPLAYLDNAATSQKPKQVIEAIAEYYQACNANVHRGAYSLSQEATEAYEKARKKVALFINARSEEIIFTKNATEALNLVAWCCLSSRKIGQVLLSQMEHHSNIVPWQLAGRRFGAAIKYAKMDGWKIDCHDAESLLEDGAASVFSFAHVSNVLGVENDARLLCRLAKKYGAISCVDASQSAPHFQMDVKRIGCDFLAFSGHKMLGPHIGVLYARKELQEELEPFLGGGDMIKSVSFGGSTWNCPPHKFEAGTPNVAAAVGLAAAVEYLGKIGMAAVCQHGQKLSSFCRQELEKIPQARFYGEPGPAGIVSFNIGRIHAHDLGSFADREAVAIRTGHHCAQPLMGVLGESSAARASFYIYNTEEEALRLADAAKKAWRKLG